MSPSTPLHILAANHRAPSFLRSCLLGECSHVPTDASSLHVFTRRAAAPSGLDLIDRAFVFVQLCAPSLRLRYLQSSTRRHSGERGLHRLHRLHCRGFAVEAESEKRKAIAAHFGRRVTSSFPVSRLTPTFFCVRGRPSPDAGSWTVDRCPCLTRRCTPPQTRHAEALGGSPT